MGKGRGEGGDGPEPRGTMKTEEDDDDSSSSVSGESSCSVSTHDHDEASYLDDSVSSSGGRSLDSTGRMVIQLGENNAYLKELLIDCTSIDNQAAADVEQYLPGNTHLKKLRLHFGNDDIATEPRQQRRRKRQIFHRGHIFHRVVSGLKGNSSIKHIEIKGAEINHETASWLIPSFAHNSRLKHIRMVNCDFVESGLAILFVALQNNKRIRSLTFHSCDWEEHNADIVASALPFMSLCVLGLVDINISPDGWMYLFQNIRACKELIQIDLSQNQLDPINIIMLTKSLTIQNTISNVSLSSCDLDDRCMQELAKGLRKYPTLTSLDISKNTPMSDKGVVYLKDLLKFNNSITEINVLGCGFNKQSTSSIESGLRYNNSFLKSFFSECTSQTLFGVVDSFEQN